MKGGLNLDSNPNVCFRVHGKSSKSTVKQVRAQRNESIRKNAFKLSKEIETTRKKENDGRSFFIEFWIKIIKLKS